MSYTGIWIESKFPSKCFKCEGKVQKGERVLYVKDLKKVYCSACGQKEIDTMAITIYGEEPKKFEPKVETHDEPEPVPEPVKAKRTRKASTVTADGEPVYTDVNDLASTMMKAIVQATLEHNKDATLAKIRESLEAELVQIYGHIPKKIVEIHAEGKKVGTVKEITHEKFEDIVAMIGASVPVFIVGEAGSGKNVLCKQIAEALGIEFYFSNAITNEYKITGFIDANGHYHETQFYKAFVEGGLFFFDEIDASIPEVLVLLNAAIENGYFNFPTGKFNAHPDFRIIAAGNTFGQGATLQYVGRYQLDAASLDRFTVVEMTYDERIEEIIANGDKEIIEAVHSIRNIARKSNLRIVMSYRAISQLHKLVNVQKMSIDKAVQYVLIKGMSVDDMNIIKSKLSVNGNKYLLAFNEAIKTKTSSY